MGYQMLSIHVMVQNYSLPIIFVLMEAKTRNAYDTVFHYIENKLLPNISPSTIVTDYETALRDVLQSYFPGVRTSGCWFHHNQAVFKNIKSSGYYRLIKTNENALKSLKLLFGLPFLPAQDIERGFRLIKMFAINHGLSSKAVFSPKATDDGNAIEIQV
ncbi:uncharacterized protein LOC132943545 [Metopolophium dirhodum]|uniref:uncharacterized protein LOC132943545 n=1 Tax=Metopolophium dirhodum TaxID=44670 RepID=UPI00298F41C4|nr:uncharacterized protein LOC132943545 [Metopolophium dirhodum]